MSPAIDRGGRRIEDVFPGIVSACRRAIAAGGTQADIVREYGVSESAVRCMLKRVGLHWPVRHGFREATRVALARADELRRAGVLRPEPSAEQATETEAAARHALHLRALAALAEPVTQRRAQGLPVERPLFERAALRELQA